MVILSSGYTVFEGIFQVSFLFTFPKIPPESYLFAMKLATFNKESPVWPLGKETFPLVFSSEIEYNIACNTVNFPIP